MNINVFLLRESQKSFSETVFLKSRIARIKFITRLIYYTNNTGSGSGVRTQILSAKFNLAPASDSFPPRHHPRTWQETCFALFMIPLPSNLISIQNYCRGKSKIVIPAVRGLFNILPRGLRGEFGGSFWIL